MAAMNYFDGVKAQGKKLDEGIDRLNKVWKSPDVLISGYGNNLAEANAYAEKLLTDIKDIEDEMAVEAKQRIQNNLEMDQLLEKSQNVYKSMMQECNDIKSVFMEYGYVPLLSESQNENNSDSKMNNTNLIDSVEVLDDLEIEFTPDLTWKCRSRTSDLTDTLLTTNCNQSLFHSTIATPHSDNLSSAVESQVPTSTRKPIKYTPVRERPQKPIFSSHFYSILKE